MARGPCHEAIAKSVGDIFSDEEIDGLVKRLQASAERKLKADPSLTSEEAIRQAQFRLTVDEAKTQLESARQKAAKTAADGKWNYEVNRMAGTESQRLSAYDLGTERQGKYSSSSTDAVGRQWEARLWGQMEIGFKQFPGLMERLSNFWGMTSPEFEDKFFRELARLNGAGQVEPTGDAMAMHAAQIVKLALDAARKIQNDYGAFIGKLPGYVARQSHDPLKIAGGYWAEIKEAGERAKATGTLADLNWQEVRMAAFKRAFRTWRDFILPLLDHEKTFGDLDPNDVNLDDSVKILGGLEGTSLVDNPADPKERMLARIFTDILTSQHEVLKGANDEADFRPTVGKATVVSRPRVLHFLDPTADEVPWLTYNRKYGKGNLFNTIKDQLSRAGRNAALMRSYGPNPELAREERIAQLQSSARARGDVATAKKLGGWWQTADWDMLNGQANAPENLRLATTFRLLRGWASMTKLGGIILSHVSNLPLSAQSFARVGGTFLDGYKGAISGIAHLPDPAKGEAADLLDIGARAFAGHLGGQFNANDGALGWSAWASRMTYKLGGFEWGINGLRQGTASMLARHLAVEHDKGWDNIEQGLRETFERFGIERDHFELGGQHIGEVEGKRYYTLAGLDPFSDNPAEREASIRLRTFIHDFVDTTASEARLREQKGLVAGTKAGTPLGEAMRSMSQLKGFLMTIFGRQLMPAIRGFGGRQPPWLLAHLILSTAIAGYISMNMKRLVAGEEARPIMGADLQDTGKIWLAAM
ncbi:MAG TPA: hypothetical protein VGF33_07255, partial [Caulobacteraceae bacterium]